MNFGDETQVTLSREHSSEFQLAVGSYPRSHQSGMFQMAEWPQWSLSPVTGDLVTA